jgi:hypothetical protein
MALIKQNCHEHGREVRLGQVITHRQQGVSLKPDL